MITIEIRDEARSDIQAAFAWSEEKQRGLGLQFLVSLDAVLQRVRRHPEAFPVDEDGVRKALLRRFPCVVLFEVEEDRATILAVSRIRKTERRRAAPSRPSPGTWNSLPTTGTVMSTGSGAKSRPRGGGRTR
ncbi:MAG: type II toxin-antitoxin system RelE/ParE family toxin [Planctomycetota bacterium]